MRIALVFSFLLVFTTASRTFLLAKDLPVIADLQTEWMVFQNDQFVGFSERDGV